MSKYEREFSNFPKQKIKLGEYENVTDEIASIINNICELKNSGNFKEVHQLIKENKDIIKKCVIDATTYRKWEEEIYNTQVYAKQEQQELYFGEEIPNCTYNDIWITGSSEYEQEKLYDALIPTMESDILPSGMVTYGTYYNNNSLGYLAFNNDSSTGYLSAHNDIMSYHYLRYAFDNPVCVKYVTYLPVATTTQYSNAYDTTLIFTFLDGQGNTLSTVEHKILASEINKEFTVRLNKILENVYDIVVTYVDRMVDSVSNVSASHVCCGELQVYGYIPESEYYALIPAMTSNSSPTGIASSGTKYGTTAEAYMAFDRDKSTQWLSGSNSDMSKQYLQYTFDSPVSVDSIRYRASSLSAKYSNSYDCDITFTLSDVDGIELASTTYHMLANDIKNRFVVQMDELITNVSSIKVTYSNRMRNGSGNASAQYVCCGEMQVYGCTTI